LHKVIIVSLKSKVTVARPGSKSLRATVPEGIVAFLELAEGDILRWKMRVGKKGWRFVVVGKDKPRNHTLAKTKRSIKTIGTALERK
jgi:hypothetical protein